MYPDKIHIKGGIGKAQFFFSESRKKRMVKDGISKFPNALFECFPAGPDTVDRGTPLPGDRPAFAKLVARRQTRWTRLPSLPDATPILALRVPRVPLKVVVGLLQHPLSPAPRPELNVLLTLQCYHPYQHLYGYIFAFDNLAIPPVSRHGRETRRPGSHPREGRVGSEKGWHRVDGQAAEHLGLLCQIFRSSQRKWPRLFADYQSCGLGHETGTATAS